MELNEEVRMILIAQRDEAVKSADKWFNELIHKQEYYNKIIDRKDKIIDLLVQCLAEERGVSEEEIRSDIGIWN